MPTMRDMALFTLSQRVPQVVDHGAQIGASGESLLEPLEQRLAVAPFVHQPVPVPRAPDDGVGLAGVARFQPGPLLAEPVAGVPVESLRLRGPPAPPPARSGTPPARADPAGRGRRG